MGEILLRAPDAMGAQHRMLHLLSLQPEDVGVVMVEMQHQARALIAAG